MCVSIFLHRNCSCFSFAGMMGLMYIYKLQVQVACAILVSNLLEMRKWNVNLFLNNLYLSWVGGLKYNLVRSARCKCLVYKDEFESDAMNVCIIKFQVEK